MSVLATDAPADVEPTRHEVQFASGTAKCAAWWYEPVGVSGPTPVLVMAHGFTGTRRDRLNAFARRFALAGFTALVFDYRGFGDSGGEPDEISLQGQRQDWIAAIAHARTLEGVDPERVITFGSSMGGGHALEAAARDSRVAAAISQVPLVDVRQLSPNPLRVRLTMLLAALRREHLPAVGQPGDVAFINAPDAEAGWRHVVAVGDDSRWRDRASTRWLLGRPYRPARFAKKPALPLVGLRGPG